MTQDALTAVKNAVRGSVKLPFAEDMGSIRSTAPTVIITRKPMAMTAVMLLFDFLSLWWVLSRICSVIFINYLLSASRNLKHLATSSGPVGSSPSLSTTMVKPSSMAFSRTFSTGA